MSGKPIGELNGRWAMLLKLTVVIVPILTTLVTAAFLPWAVWVTSNIYTSQRIAEHVATLTSQVNVLDDRVDNLPPAEWKARTIKLEEASLENREDHTQIKIALAEIKADMKMVISHVNEPK